MYTSPKKQKWSYLRNSVRAIWADFLCKGYVSRHLHFAKKIVSPFLAAILNVCVKCENKIIREMVQDSNFSQFFSDCPTIFGGHFENLYSGENKK